MSTPSFTLQTFGQTLIGKLPDNIRALLQGNQNARLLKNADVILLVYEDKLYNLGNAQWCSIQLSDEKSLFGRN